MYFNVHIQLNAYKQMHDMQKLQVYLFICFIICYHVVYTVWPLKKWPQFKPP